MRGLQARSSVLGAVRELLGFGQPALELHDLGVVDTAEAGEGRHRVRVAEVAGAVGPLARALEVGDVPAGADRVAVDGERRERVELAGERRGARLVEQELPLGDLALLDERRSPGAAARGSRGCGRRSGGPAPRPAWRACRASPKSPAAERREALLQRPVAVLGGLLLEVEQALGAPHPAVRHGHLQVAPLIVRDPGGDVGRPKRLAFLQVAAVGALEIRRLRPPCGRPTSLPRRGGGRPRGSSSMLSSALVQELDSPRPTPVAAAPSRARLERILDYVRHRVTVESILEVCHAEQPA